MNRKILGLFAAFLLVITCVFSVSAEAFDHKKTGSISVTLAEKSPIVGAELGLYYIATVGITSDETLSYIYTEEFAKSGISIDDPELAAKLDTYLSENKTPATTLCTDAEGTAVWENLPLGLYFIRQTNAVEGFAPCTPFLVTVPTKNAEGYGYAVNASPKTEAAKLTAITIQKIWNTDASTEAADSVTVQLLLNGNVVQTATLSASNNWQTTYKDMPESDAYTIQEVNVPKGFTPTYTQKGYTFTVTNTASLAQTGQLIWPIPMLAFVGILLIAAGIVLLQKKRTQNA